MDSCVIGLKYDGDVIGYRFYTEWGIYDVRKGYITESILVSKYFICNKDGNSYYTDSDDTVIDISDNKEFLEFICSSFGYNTINYIVNTSNSILNILTKNNITNERDYMPTIYEFLVDGGGSRILTLFGVRRTGKTFSMYLSIKYLLEIGISPSKIVYISLRGNSNVTSSYLSRLLVNLLSIGVKYIFIDEITYLDGNLDFLSSFGDSTNSFKLIVSGTNSSVFIKPLGGILYDRSDIISTSYIPFSEYMSLYSNSDIGGYIKSGGLLRSSRYYENGSNFDYNKYIKYSIDYVGTSIIDNMFSCFDRYDMSYDYPNLCRLYDKDSAKLKSIIYKWINVYSKELVNVAIRRAFKFDDIGNMVDLALKRDSSGDYNEFGKRLNSMFLLEIGYKDIFNLDDSVVAELKKFLCSIDCFYSIKSSNSEYILPIAVRYGCACEAIRVLNDNFYKLSDGLNIGFNEKELSALLLSSIEGVLLEEIIRIDLSKHGIVCSKYRNMGSSINAGAEVDIVTFKYLIEVKRSSKFFIGQLRWLLSDDINELYPNRDLLLLLNGNTDTTIECSEYDCLFGIIQDRESRGIPVSKRLKNDLVKFSTRRRKVRVLSIEKFLISLDKEDIA